MSITFFQNTTKLKSPVKIRKNSFPITNIGIFVSLPVDLQYELRNSVAYHIIMTILVCHVHHEVLFELGAWEWG
jgi:hypothetical protein